MISDLHCLALVENSLTFTIRTSARTALFIIITNIAIFVAFTSCHPRCTLCNRPAMLRTAISALRCTLTVHKRLLPICVCLTERRTKAVGPHMIIDTGDSPTTDVLHTARRRQYMHATITSGNDLIRTVFCSDLRQEEGWKYCNMLITKLNIMFAAWQHSDGHGLTCVCICMHFTHRIIITAFVDRNQGAKSVDKNAFDAACSFFFGFLSLFLFTRS